MAQRYTFLSKFMFKLEEIIVNEEKSFHQLRMNERGGNYINYEFK